MKIRHRLAHARMLALNLAICLCATQAFPKELIDAVPRGNWALAESLKEDTSISILMTSGDKMNGRFLEMDSDSIHINIDKQARIYPRAGVAEIWQLRAPDRKLSGAIYGVLAGAAADAIAAGAGGYLRATGDTAGRQIGPGFILAGMGLGTAIGVTTDALIKGNSFTAKSIIKFPIHIWLSAIPFPNFDVGWKKEVSLNFRATGFIS